MSDFENTFREEIEKAYNHGKVGALFDVDLSLYKAIASMQGEVVAWSYSQRHTDGHISSHVQSNDPNKQLVEYGNIFEVEPLFTYPPSAASKIAEQDARIKELESQLVSTDQLSVHDIRIGMSALLQCEVSEIETMDNRCYDESYQAVQRVIEAISLSVKQEKLFGSEIYQAAANHFEQKIKELEQQLEVVRKEEYQKGYDQGQRDAGDHIARCLV